MKNIKLTLLNQIQTQLNADSFLKEELGSVEIRVPNDAHFMGDINGETVDDRSGHELAELPNEFQADRIEFGYSHSRVDSYFCVDTEDGIYIGTWLDGSTEFTTKTLKAMNQAAQLIDAWWKTI